MEVFEFVQFLLFLKDSNSFVTAHLGWRVLGGLEIVCCLALSSYTVLTVSEETQSVQHGHNPLFYEEGRELLGLLIIVLWIAASLVYTPERYFLWLIDLYCTYHKVEFLKQNLLVCIRLWKPILAYYFMVKIIIQTFVELKLSILFVTTMPGDFC